MRLSPIALGVTAGLVLAVALLLVGLGSMSSTYGDPLLDTAASLYPGYANDGSFGDLIVGVLYALLDGLICGLLFGAVYNKLMSNHKSVDWMVGSGKVDWLMPG